MRSRTVAIIVLGLLVIFGGGLAYAWQPSIKPSESPDPAIADQAMIAIGAHLAAAGSCAVCHTSSGGQPFAGGLALNTPFGTIYSTNITPDPDTGIGAWSLDAFKRAMRQGVSRDGHLLYPAFPYVHFTKMSDGDIAAVYAFMMTREAVRAEPRTNRLIFPLNFRPLVAGWNLLFLHQGEVRADPGQSAEWNRGRYLVDSLGHCAACHTPLNKLGAEKSAEAFDGGVIDGWDAPALNALSRAVKPWTKPQLVSYLRTGLADQHGAAAGPMLPVTREMAKVPVADLGAMAEYLLSIQVPAANAATSAAPASTSSSQTATASPDVEARAQRGAVLFAATCASCHGVGAPMLSIAGRPSLALSTAVNSDSPRNVVNMIVAGIPWSGEDKIHYMPSFAAPLTNQQIGDIATFLRVRVATRPVWPDLDSTIEKLHKEGDPS